MILKGGEPISTLHFLVEGEARVEGVEHPSGVVGVREPLGILTMFAGVKEGVHAVASKDVVSLSIDLDDLLDVLEDHFDLLRNEIRRQAWHMLQLRKQVADGTYLAAPTARIEEIGDQLDLLERIILVTQGAVFRRSNIDAMIELARGLEEARFAKGEQLWEYGAPAGHMYLLVRGRVRCELPDGRVFHAGPGYPLGNLESQAGERRWYRAVADEHLVALISRTDLFIDVLEDHFEMAMDFLGTMSRGILAQLAVSKTVVPGYSVSARG